MFLTKNKFAAISYVFALLLFASTAIYAYSNELNTNSQSDHFIENKGQWNEAALFLANEYGMKTWITETGIVFDHYTDLHSEINEEKARKGHVVKMSFLEANNIKEIITNDASGYYFNYLLGNDRNNWAAKVRSYRSVELKNIYKNIDLKYYFDKGNVRYDFWINPKGDAENILLSFEGADNTKLSEHGDLIIETSVGNFMNGELYAYQIINGKKEEVECRFEKVADNTYGFELGTYNRKYPLIIDPLVYSTYLGGADDDEITCMATDDDDNIYIGGNTESNNFPTTTGAYQTNRLGWDDIFVTKLNPSGSALVYSTYIGGSYRDNASDLFVDSDGYVYFTGDVDSWNYPVSASALHTNHSSGFNPDGIVTKLNTDGTDIVFSTYLVGSDEDKPLGIVVDGDGNSYICGFTASSDFDISTGAYQTTMTNSYEEAFVLKLNSSGSTLVYGTYIGGSSDDKANDIQIDGSGYAYITGSTESDDFPASTGAYQTSFGGDIDAFLTKFNTSASDIEYSTYIGDSDDDFGYAISLDNDKAIISGKTRSSDYPTTSGAFQTSGGGIADAFVTKFNSNGTSLEYSTFIGGSNNDAAYSMISDNDGNIYITGETESTNFPVTTTAYQSSKDVDEDAFLFKLSSDGEENLYSTYFGGDDEDIGYAICTDGNISFYIAGKTVSSDFPTTTGAYQTSNPGNDAGFVSKLSIGIESPEPILPMDESVAVPLNTTFSWSSVDGANDYDLQISTASDFSSTVDQQNGITNTSVQSSELEDENVYYWRVRANSTNFTSNWSETWQFSTPGLVPVPDLVSPADDSYGISVSSVTLDWDEAETATSYTLQVSTQSNFVTTVVNEENTTLTSYEFTSLTNGEKYYWRVLAKTDEDISAWTDPWSFTAALGTVTLSTPSDGSYAVGVDPSSFSWQSLEGATTYDIIISTSPDFDEGLTSIDDIASTDVTVSGLNKNSEYWWKVRGKNPGDTGPWSDAFKLTTSLTYPNLYRPNDGAYSISVDPALSWIELDVATLYDVQISRSSDFSTIDFWDYNVSGGEKSFTGLSNGQLYYWRVRSKNPGDISEWSPPRSFTAELGAVELSTPVNNSEAVALDPTEFTWQDLTGATMYDIKISTSPSFDENLINENDMSATSYTVTGLANGTQYWWTVKGKNPGDAGPWSNIFNFKTKLAPPVLDYPDDNEINIALDPVVQWNSAAGAEHYDIRVATDDTFSAIIYSNNDIEDLSEDISGLDYNTDYYWQVRSGSTEDQSAWSDHFVFTTLLAPPLLVNPSNEAVGQSLTVDLQWNEDDPADTYSLQVATDDEFNNIIADETGIANNNYEITGLDNGQLYYWKVKAHNSGKFSNWSEVFTFHTFIEPPELLSPLNMAVNISTDPLLEWNASEGATFYNLQVSPLADFSSSTTTYSNLTETDQDISGLENAEEYYWRMQAADSYETSVWSDSHSFTTKLASPQLIAPADGMAGQTENIEFSWNSVNSAESYTLQISEQEDFSSLHYENGDMTTTAITLSIFDVATEYFWRVKAKSSILESDWSETRNFVTVLNPPELSSPADGTTKVSIDPAFSWQPVTGAHYYDIEISDDSFSENIIEVEDITGTDVTVTGLDHFTTYEWRVQSKTDQTTSEYSEVWEFRTELNMPELSYPSNNAFDLPQDISCSWGSVSGAENYDFQLSEEDSFTSPVIYETGINDLYKELADLTFGKTYYWRVRAIYGVEFGEWSEVYSFKIQEMFIDSENGLRDLKATSADWGDYDCDDDLDLLITGKDDGTVITKLYKNLGDGTFSDESHPFDDVSHGSVKWFDLDNDGNLDLLLTGNDGSNPVTNIYENSGTNFTEISSAIDDLENSSSATGDYDNDGKQDIAVCGYNGTDEVTKIYHNNGGSFTDISAGLQGVQNGDIKWLDYNSDGFPDLLVTGESGGTRYSLIYRNNGDGSFTDISAGLYGLTNSSVDCGDYDSDGDIDVVICGNDGTDNHTEIYRNDAGVFTNILAGLTGVEEGSCQWGDYDNDGDLDLVISGNSGNELITKIYTNEGSDTFTEADIDLKGVRKSVTKWADYDKDNDLDLLISGLDGTDEYTALLRNDIKTSNTIPDPPDDLTVAIGINSATVSWNSGSDDETNDNGLSYNIRLGRVESGFNQIAPGANLTNGFRKVVRIGNTGANKEMQIFRLPGGHYYWSVQTIDNSFAGSEFSTAGSFTVTDYHSLGIGTGWSLISTYVEPFDTDIETICEEIVDNMLMVKNLDGDLYFPDLNINDIDDWNIEEGYKIYMDNQDELTFEGVKVRPENVTLSLAEDWNWIPYLRDEDMSVETAMEDIEDDMLIIKDINGNLYIPSLNINSLQTLKTGMGYIIYMNNSSEYTYPENESYPRMAVDLAERTKYEAEHLIPAFENTGNDCSLILKISVPDGSEIGVYDTQNELIGSGKIIDDLTYVTIWGDDLNTEEKDGGSENELLRIRLFDPAGNYISEIGSSDISEITGNTGTQAVLYKPDAVYMATAESDTDISLNDEISIHPNPGNGRINVRYSIESASSIKFEIYDITGKMIYSSPSYYQQKGSHIEMIDIKDAQSGVYNLLLKIGGKVITKKLIIHK